MPVFDYFVLKQLYGSHKKIYDWILLDLYDMALAKKFILSDNCYLVSEWFCEIFSKYNIAPHIFYPAWLKYKNQRIKYYILIILEMAIPEFKYCTYKVVTLPNRKSKNPFIVNDDSEHIHHFEIFTSHELNIKNKNDFYGKSLMYYREGKSLSIINYSFKEKWDYFHCNVPSGKRFISENLKLAIENAEITGVKFSELEDINISFLNT